MYFNAIRKHNEILSIVSKKKIKKKRITTIEEDKEISEFLLPEGEFERPLTQPISPQAPRDLEYEDKRKRVKKYISSITLTSDYYLSARSQFRKRTFKPIKHMHNMLIEERLNISIDMM